MSQQAGVLSLLLLIDVPQAHDHQYEPYTYNTAPSTHSSVNYGGMHMNDQHYAYTDQQHTAADLHIQDNNRDVYADNLAIMQRHASVPETTCKDVRTENPVQCDEHHNTTSNYDDTHTIATNGNSTITDGTSTASSCSHAYRAPPISTLAPLVDQYSVRNIANLMPMAAMRSPYASVTVPALYGPVHELSRYSNDGFDTQRHLYPGYTSTHHDTVDYSNTIPVPIPVPLLANCDGGSARAYSDTHTVHQSGDHISARSVAVDTKTDS